MTSKYNMNKEEATRFYLNLLDPDNSRIIFSAPFGVGKTTFLKEVSKSEINKTFCSQQDFNFFHLYPVNYSVASNEDIFQYIKYDLIYSLIDKGVQFQQNDFDFLKSLKKYLKSNAHKLAAKLFLFIPKVGKDLYGIFEQLDKVKDEIIKACENDVADEGEKFYNYLLDLESKAGSLYEMDIYSKLIQTVLARQKKETGAESVLIIDDLDRIDPQHIFRLLNVFSAHFDIEGSGNKFGFDKIIFVCDLNNIRKIFANLYGANVDFNGYIDKFYSKTVFKFLNHNALLELMDTKLSRTPLNEFDLGAQERKFLLEILTIISSSDKLNFRSVIKAEADKNFDKIDSLYRKRNLREFLNCRLLGVSIFLRDLFGNYESFNNVLTTMIAEHSVKQEKSLTKEHEDVYYYYNLYFTPVLHYKDHGWRPDAEFDVWQNPINVKFRFKANRNSCYIEPASAGANYPNAHVNFWADFKKAVDILHEKHLV